MGGFVPNCYAQTFVEMAKEENQMDFTRLEFYRNRIGQPQDAIAFVLGVPLEIYKEFEAGTRHITKPVEDAFFGLLDRFPGSRDFSRPTIDAIGVYKHNYFAAHNEYPKGWHDIPAPWITRKFKLVDLSPYSPI